jgi:hypothetical protein
VATRGRAVSEDSLGAWLVKTSPRATPVAELVRTRFQTVTHRCVRPTYRAATVRAGQPVLLWVSGRDRQLPAGIYAVGSSTGPVELVAGEPAMPLRLRPLDPVVTREQILTVAGLSDLEVIRMPAGSNPSYLDTAQYRALLTAFPQVSPT